MRSRRVRRFLISLAVYGWVAASATLLDNDQSVIAIIGLACIVLAWVVGLCDGAAPPADSDRAGDES